MRPQDIVVGNTYRHKDNPHYGYVKVIGKLKPKEAPNPYTYTIVKCEHTIGRNDMFGFIKYFRPCDLIKENEG